MFVRTLTMKGSEPSKRYIKRNQNSILYQDNPKIKDKLTRLKAGLDLVKLFGFIEQTDEKTKEITFNLSSQLSLSFIKVSIILLC